MHEYRLVASNICFECFMDFAVSAQTFQISNICFYWAFQCFEVVISLHESNIEPNGDHLLMSLKKGAR